jgi:hypothetical protein
MSIVEYLPGPFGAEASMHLAGAAWTGLAAVLTGSTVILDAPLTR